MPNNRNSRELTELIGRSRQLKEEAAKLVAQSQRLSECIREVEEAARALERKQAGNGNKAGASSEHLAGERRL